MSKDQGSRSKKPLVSIGVPVFNGENYLRQALQSILAQTYDNFELIISDNASTDLTRQISAEFAARDPRVKVYRSDKNLGAARNYNRVFRLARGKYFKWAAHDDILAPTFVERAVDVLESDPGVVVCSSRTRRINDRGEVIGSYESEPTWGGPSPSRRFRSLVLTPHACVVVFGLVRSNELARTPLIAPYVNSDRVLLAEIGLRGRFFEIPEYLFFRRDHEGCSIRAYDYRRRVVWFDPAKSASLAFPEWNELRGYAGAVVRGPVGIGERMRCCSILAALSLKKWRPLLADFKYAAYGVVGKYR
jgi:glycosyltransferase involved in cell wall biosynthesis